jgi:hypothetical protein
VAPLIGILVGEAARSVSRHGQLRKALFSLVSLYGAVALFGLAIPFGVPGGLDTPERLYESVLALWFGLTGFGLVLILWPLALINHHGLWWLEGRLAKLN